MSIKIALAGNPNCGKTTMFNDLTGSSQYVGNWPGVTVEKKEGHLKGTKDVIIVDLPGIYSLSPYTLEEVISRNYLINEKPDVIINIVDASNIERNLYLTTQLVEVGIPVIIALNMIDIVQNKGDKIYIQQLSAATDCEVIETSAVKGIGSKIAVERAVALAKKRQSTVAQHKFSSRIETALSEINHLISDSINPAQTRWFAIKLFERDAKVWEEFKFETETELKLNQIISDCEQALDDDSESLIANERYVYISKLIKSTVTKKSSGLTTSDKIDQVITNRWLALPIFAAIMWFVYYVSIQTIGDMSIGWVENVFAWISSGVESGLTAVGAADWLISLSLDGIIAGVGAVLSFVPQMMILFFFLSLLEDCGYMARVAFIMDRIFRRFGLSGKSFIPMLIASGCSVPGIMASRTIENEQDRRITVMITSFIPCGAKLPIIALIAGALFPESGWIAPSIYFLGIAMVIISGIILKKTKLFAGDPAPFVMELPQYHLPGLKGVTIHMWERGKSFIIKAGTIIFAACGIIWFLQSFNWSLEMVDAGESILASIGHTLAPFFFPLGFGQWQAAVATITGLVAKENVVGTFGILYGLAEVSEDGVEIWSKLTRNFTQVSAYSFMVFNMLCAPCFAAIGAIKREMGNWKWTWLTIGYQTLLAYTMSFIVYQLGSVLFLGKSPDLCTSMAIALVLGLLWLIFAPARLFKSKPIEKINTNV